MVIDGSKYIIEATPLERSTSLVAVSNLFFITGSHENVLLQSELRVIPLQLCQIDREIFLLGLEELRMRRFVQFGTICTI